MEILVMMIVALVMLVCFFFGIAVIGNLGNYTIARDLFAKQVLEAKRAIATHTHNIAMYEKQISEAKETLKEAIRFNRGKLK